MWSRRARIERASSAHRARIERASIHACAFAAIVLQCSTHSVRSISLMERRPVKLTVLATFAVFAATARMGMPVTVRVATTHRY